MNTRLFFILLLSSTLITQITQAQTPVDTTMGWRNNLVASLNLTQISFKDWSQGGVNTVSWVFGVSGSFDYIQPLYLWSNKLKLSYGQSKIGDQDVRKTDDEIFLSSMYSHKVGWLLDPYVAATLRTQFGPGYNYTDTSRTQQSDFFDPGYLTQSTGFTYSPTTDFKTRLGVAVKETFTKTYTNFSDDPKTTEVEKTKVETGIESVTDYKIVFMENMQYATSLSLFSAFNHLDVWDVRWDNIITAKINKWFSMQFNVLLVYMKQQSPKTQLKEVLGLGISYTLL